MEASHGSFQVVKIQTEIKEYGPAFFRPPQWYLFNVLDATLASASADHQPNGRQPSGV